MFLDSLHDQQNRKYYLFLGGALALGVVWAALREPNLLMLFVFGLLIWGVIHVISPEARKKPTLKYALGMFVVSCILLNRNHAPLATGKAVLTLYPVIVLLISTALFRHSLNRAGLSNLMSRLLISPNRTDHKAYRVGLVSAVMTVFTGQGAVALICSTLAARIQNKVDVAKITNRALCASMYVLPTTIASASVAMSIPGLRFLDVMIYGLPLMLVLLISSMRIDLHETSDALPALKIDKPLASLLLIVFFAVSVGLFLAGTSMVLALAAAMLASYLAEALYNKNAAMVSESIKSIDPVSPEILLLLNVGLLMFAISSSGLVTGVAQSIGIVNNDIVAVLLIVIGMPLITIAGIHQMILFGAFFTLMNPVLFSTDVIKYIVWTTMFMMGNLLSPVSITAIVAATSLKLNSTETSYKANYKLCSVLVIVVISYVFFLRSYM
jgi:hypothetical protein